MVREHCTDGYGLGMAFVIAGSVYFAFNAHPRTSHPQMVECLLSARFISYLALLVLHPHCIALRYTADRTHTALLASAD